MIFDMLFYLGIGFLLYSHWGSNSFDRDKPKFWGIVLAWPIALLVSFLTAWVDVEKERKK